MSVRRPSVALVALASAIALVALGAIAPVAPAGTAASYARAAAQDGAKAALVREFPELGLTLRLPPLEGLTQRGKTGGQLLAAWTGRAGASAVDISLFALATAEFDFHEPEDVSDLVHENLGRAVPGYDFRQRELIGGKFGWAPYASLCRGALPEKDAAHADGAFLVLAGLLPERGYSVQVTCKPAPEGEAAAAIDAFLRSGVSYAGPVRDHEWTDEEARARFVEFAPEDAIEGYGDPERTEHYIVIGNASGNKAFARHMEECYEAIRAIFPFDEVEGRRRMPVFLFRTREQYYAFYSKIARISVEQAEKSGGHAWRDYYATHYGAPGDSVHIHEATHQIFANRLRLKGGGSWFQEGVAEYVSTKPSERGGAARLVKKERHTKLREFVALPSLLYSSKEDQKGGDEAGDHYKEAALLIEFLRESKWGRGSKADTGKFDAFLQRVGRLPRGDVAALEAAIQEIYGCDLDALEAAWVQYCKKR